MLETTQIMSDVCFITDHVVYSSSDKTKINRFNRDGTLFLPGVDAPHVYVRAWALGCFYCHISNQTFRRALTASVDSCAEITKSGRVWRKVPESGAGSVGGCR